MKVYTQEQEERFVGVLKDIQRNIPSHLLRMVVEQTKIAPVVEMVMDEAVKDETIDVGKREQIQNLIDAGTFSKMQFSENQKYKKMVENHVNREINKAIKEGRLPPKSHVKYLPSIMKLNETQN